jgi:tetratricopeptide (TPR) repeat protein
MPVPRRDRRWLWAGRAVTLVIVAGLGWYFWRVGWERASVIAGVVGLFVGLIALVAPYLLPAPQPAGEPMPEPDRVEDSGTQTTGRSGPTQVVEWPVQVGQVPALASAFQARPGLRERIAAARAARDGAAGGRGAGVVLTQVLAGGGGVGKSQLAASYADQALREGTDLVVWVDASTPTGVVTGYAQAAARVQAPGASGQPTDAETDARVFLDWAAAMSKSWLVVLDDITDPGTVTDWWPVSHTGTGWVLATTRRRDSVLSGAGRRVVGVDVYEADEAVAYLTERLTGAGKAHLLDDQARDLAEALGWLPLALSHAAAYMIDQRIGCGAYLALYTAGERGLPDLMPAAADADGYGRQAAVTLLLALDAADAQEPVGLARPAMDLAAVLDPTGHPEAFWTTHAVRTYLATHHSTGNAAGRGRRRWFRRRRPVTVEQARDAILLLDRYSLATLDEQAGPRAVRVHALTARAAHEAADGQVPDAAWAAADALLALWPDSHHTHPDLTIVLRANTTILASHAGDPLWSRDDGAHPLLWRAGLNVLHTGLHNAAITHWQHTTDTALRLLGPEHPDTLAARANLASSYWQAGRTADAITILEEVAAESVRLLGPEHPDTLAARANLASSYRQAGRTADAITIEEEVAAERVRLLGPEHPDTLTARANLASSYRQAGRTADAITILEEVAAESVRLLGPEHPSTLAVLEALREWKNQ